LARYAAAILVGAVLGAGVVFALFRQGGTQKAEALAQAPAVRLTSPASSILPPKVTAETRLAPEAGAAEPHRSAPTDPRTPEAVKKVGSSAPNDESVVLEVYGAGGAGTKLAIEVEAKRKAPALLQKLAVEAAKGLKSPEAGSRLESARALKRLGAAGREADVRPLLGDSDPAVRREAVGLLSGLRDGGSYGKVLEVAKSDKNPETRARAVRALPVLGGRDNKATMELLTAALASEDPRTRLAGVEALTLMSPELLTADTRRTLEALAEGDGLFEEMDGKRRYPVREAAQAILLAIGTEPKEAEGVRR
jgi:HEAT repeat protein